VDDLIRMKRAAGGQRTAWSSRSWARLRDEIGDIDRL
jgi:hypothetical protein